MQRPTKAQLRELYDSGPDATISFIEQLLDIIEHLSGEVSLHETRIRALENQKAKNSQNSHKPPSSDGPGQEKRTRSLRKKSKRRAGGQKGHDGHTLKRVANPDQVVVHKAAGCCDCGFSLGDIAPERYEARQVFDIPPIELQVTEHRAEIKSCPHCQRRTTADFPKEVTQPVQYGAQLKAQVVYLMNQHLLPYQRTSDLIADLYQHRISVGTLFNINRSCYQALEIPVERIKQHILNSDVVHFDETSLRVDGKGYWLHGAGTDEATHYAVHPNRGTVAMNDSGILPNYRGIAVHDGLRSYFTYEDCAHALCNAHHLRELNFIIERYEQKWARQMKKLLVTIKDAVFQKKAEGKSSFHKTTLKKMERKYQDILATGFKENPEYPCRRKRKLRTDAQRLLRRLLKYQRQTLAFMDDFKVPFDNNLAERDIRMVKVQQKISGCFRSTQGALISCRIKSYLSTAKKRSQNPLHALKVAFE